MATSSSRRAEAPPVTPKNVALSKKHLRESIRMNAAHAREHQKAIVEDKKKLAELSKGTGYGAKAAAAAKAAKNG